MPSKDEQIKAIELIYREAHSNAMVACQRHIDENPDQWYPCGFAWVDIKPARGPFVAFLKVNKIGHIGTYGGWCVYNPSDNMTQWMDAKYIGALAFAQTLQRYGINATAVSRID